jgi:hypothetical protein
MSSLDWKGQYVDEPYPTEEEFESLTVKLVTKCPQLVDLRIPDWAWHIVRPDGEGGEPALRRLEAWRDEKDLPEAFQWSVPPVF